MIRIAAALLLLALVACSTTSTVHQPVPPQDARIHAYAYAYAFENNGGDDLEGIAKLDRLIHARLLIAGLVVATGEPSAGRVEIELAHYYVRSNAARFLAGIMAGRDKIVSQVKVLDEAGKLVGGFEVETTNISAWGSTADLMDEHADEIAARLQSGP